MPEDRPQFGKLFYGSVIAVLVLQVITLAVAVRFGTESAQRDTTLLERTEVIVDEMLPGIRKDLSGVSNNVSDIKEGVTILRKLVDQVDQHVGQVGTAVTGVSRSVEGMNHSITAFLRDTSGLIWGHSLNPYVLMALLVMILLSVPVFGAVFAKKRRFQAASSQPTVVSPDSAFAKRLDDLSQLIAQMREQQKSPEAAVEIKKLMEETKRLLREAQADLVRLTERSAARPKDTSKSEQTLH